MATRRTLGVIILFVLQLNWKTITVMVSMRWLIRNAGHTIYSSTASYMQAIFERPAFIQQLSIKRDYTRNQLEIARSTFLTLPRLRSGYQLRLAHWKIDHYHVFRKGRRLFHCRFVCWTDATWMKCVLTIRQTNTFQVTLLITRSHPFHCFK